MKKNITIQINGKPAEVKAEQNLLEIMESLKLTNLEFGIAACLNGEVVDKSKWSGTMVQSNDQIDLLQAFQGG